MFRHIFPSFTPCSFHPQIEHSSYKYPSSISLLFNLDFVKYVDLTQGQTYKEIFDDTTGIASKVISDWSQGLKTKDLKPSINLVDSEGKVETLENGNDVNYPNEQN